MNTSLLLFTFFTLISLSYACVGVFPAPMCGGGCGGGGGMPPPSCGCMGGGRKKRSVPEIPAVFGSASDDKDFCNTPELKKIILENMHPTPMDSSKAINSVLESRQLHRFVVVCAENQFEFAIRAETTYCGAVKHGHKCHAFSL